jgi:hypothetical protein
MSTRCHRHCYHVKNPSCVPSGGAAKGLGQSLIRETSNHNFRPARGVSAAIHPHFFDTKNVPNMRGHDILGMPSLDMPSLDMPSLDMPSLDMPSLDNVIRQRTCHQPHTIHDAHGVFSPGQPVDCWLSRAGKSSLGRSETAAWQGFPGSCDFRDTLHLQSSIAVTRNCSFTIFRRRLECHSAEN